MNVPTYEVISLCSSNVIMHLQSVFVIAAVPGGELYKYSCEPVQVFFSHRDICSEECAAKIYKRLGHTRLEVEH